MCHVKRNLPVKETELKRMKTTTISSFRLKMKDYIQSIFDDQEHLFVSGPKNKNIVILTEEEYDSLNETAYLLKSPANALRLMQSLKEFEEGKIIKSNL